MKKRKGAPLGQHFLKNPQVAKAVAEGARIQENDLVLEIGPGKGMLTGVLLLKGARVLAIEKDPAMIHILNETFRKEIKEKKLEIKEMDIRDFLTLETQNSELRTSYKVAANIPYYITGELIRAFLTAAHQPTSIAFLVQKEVAQRIARSKKESILSLSVKVYGIPRYVKTVARGNFNPPPSVDSAILVIEKISRNNFIDVSEEVFFKTVKAGFAQKRKTLGGNLKRVFGTKASSALTVCSINPKSRAEDIPLSQWLSLTKCLETLV